MRIVAKFQFVAPTKAADGGEQIAEVVRQAACLRRGMMERIAMSVFRLWLISALCAAATSAWAEILTLECAGTMKIIAVPETGTPYLGDVPYFKVVADLDAKTVSGFWGGANGPLAMPITAIQGQVLTFKDHMSVGVSEDESIEGTVDRATGKVVAAYTHRSGVGTIMPFTVTTSWSLQCKPSERH